MRRFAFCSLFSAAALTAASASAAEVQAVRTLDLQRYLGTWYEIASIPQPTQRGCTCTVAQYSMLSDDRVRVRNSCRLGSPGGKPIVAVGQARVADSAEPAKLRVSFFGGAEADYWVLAVADDYSHALVGTPDRSSLWVLSRERTLDRAVFNELMDFASAQGFDASRLQGTRQTGCARLGK